MRLISSLATSSSAACVHPQKFRSKVRIAGAPLAKFLECTDFVTGEPIQINFDNVETFENLGQSGRSGTKISFVGGRYVLVKEAVKQLTDRVNGHTS